MRPQIQRLNNLAAAPASHPVSLEDLGWDDMGDDAPPQRPAVVLPLTPFPATPETPEPAAPARAINQTVSQSSENQQAEKQPDMPGVKAPANGGSAADHTSSVPEVVRQQELITQRMIAIAASPDKAEAPADKPAATPSVATPKAAQSGDSAAKALASTEEAPAEEASTEQVSAEKTPAESASIEKTEIKKTKTGKISAKKARPQSTGQKRKPANAGRKAAFTLRLNPERHLRLRLASAICARSSQQLVTEALDQFLKTIPELDALAETARPGSK